MSICGRPLRAGVVMDSGLGAFAPPRNDTSACNTQIKIDPAWVLLLDQTYLPVTPPLLQFFLSRDSGDRVVVDFERHQLVDGISRAKAFDGFGLVFISPADKIVGHAQIERAVFLACKEIDVIGHGSPSWLW